MPNNFGLFFSWNGQVIRLPVNPASLPVARENDNSTYNVLSIGEIMVPRTPKLRTVTISSFFPGRPFPGVLTPNGFQPPEFYIQFFESAFYGETTLLYTPVRYYENGEPFMTGDTGFECLVTSFRTEERGGETGDFYYDLELTEYRAYDPTTVRIDPPISVSSPAVATTEPTRSIPEDQLYVGCPATVNGPMYNTTNDTRPAATASGDPVKIKRISDLNVYVEPEFGGRGHWVQKSQITPVVPRQSFKKGSLGSHRGWKL